MRTARRELGRPPVSQRLLRELHARREAEHLEREIHLLRSIYGEDYPAEKHIERLRAAATRDTEQD